MEYVGYSWYYQDSNCLAYRSWTYKLYNDAQAYCVEEYGANLIMIDSAQLFNEIGELCNKKKSYISWIGIELNTCLNNENFTLKYVDGTPLTDYSFIEWCDGYPNNQFCGNESYIHLDATNMSNYCLRNTVDIESTATCGYPFRCVIGADHNLNSNYTAEDWRGWVISSLIIAFIASVFTCPAFCVLYKHLRGKDYNYVDNQDPSRAIICTGILYPLFQFIQWTSWWFLGTISTITCVTNAMVTQNPYYLVANHPVYAYSWGIVAGIAIVCGLISTVVLFPIHMISRYVCYDIL